MIPGREMEPIYFPNAAAFRDWLTLHGTTEKELSVGFHKRDTGVPSMTWPESVDEALCFGWIDGVRHKVDQERYKIRFTPRRPTSNWSAVNIERMRVLTEEGRMTEAGLRAFGHRKEHRSRIYTYEQAERPAYTEAEMSRFRSNSAAYAFFEKQPKSYRTNGAKWLAGAKLPATREKRLLKLIEACAAGKRLW